MEIIQVEKRNTTLSAKQLRRTGFIPCSVYGGQLEKDIPIQMSQKSAELLFRSKHIGSTLRLELDGEKIPVLIKEKTHNNLGNQLEHISFEALKADVQVNSVAQIFVKNENLVPGRLEQMVFDVPFTSLPKDMVDTVTIDLEGMPVGTTITLSEIPEFTNPAVAVKIPADSVVLKIRDKDTAVEEASEETAEA